MGLASDTGSSATDNITSNAAVKGIGQAGTLVTIKQGDVTLGTTMADGTGAWSFSPSGLTDGVHTLTATQSGPAGAATTTLSFTLDKTAPVLSMTQASSTAPITGSAQANTLVTVKEGLTTLGTTTADSTGAWSFSPSGLAQGSHTLTAIQTDTAGNSGTATLAVTIDSIQASPGATPTEGSDVLIATQVGWNVVRGLGGNDTMSVQDTRAGTVIYGGDGNDSVNGSLLGADYIDGGAGNDVLYGNAGNDIILGRDGNDSVYGGAGDDLLYTGIGNDYVQGDAGNDTIYLRPGNNVIDGGVGADTAVFGGNYADYALSLSNGAMKVVSAEGASTLANIETIRFHDGAYNVTSSLFSSNHTQSLSPTPDPIKALLGKETLTVNYGAATLETFTYRPQGDITGVLITFHGNTRNAEGARDAAIEMADKYGLYVVAPKFPELEYPNSDYQMGGIISADGQLLPKDDWTVSLADDIAVWAHQQVGNDPADETIAFGHSAGGQFASRLAAFGPDIFDKIIIANPSTHVRASLTENIPYGFDGYMSSTDEDAYLKDYLADPVTIYLGSDDNDPNDPDLAIGPAAMRQGDNRLERGLFVYNEARQLAEAKGWAFHWELVVAEDVGHSTTGVLNAPQFQDAFDGRYLGSSTDWFI
jgi:hypothetical protein